MTDCLFPHNDDRPVHAASRGFLCAPSYARLEQHLTELPALAKWLHANLSGGSGSGFGDYTTGSRDKPLPIKTALADHLAAITDTVNSWCRLIAEERDLRGPWRPLPSNGWPERDRLRRAVEQTASLENLTTFLLAQLDWTAQQTWVDDYCTEIEDLTSDAHGLVPSRPRTYHLPAPCPSCEQQALTRSDGDDYVTCESCGRLWTEDEYARLCVILAAEQQRVVAGWALPEDVGNTLGLNPKTIRTWARRGVVAAACAVLPGIRDPRLRVLPADVQTASEERQAS